MKIIYLKLSSTDLVYKGVEYRKIEEIIPAAPKPKDSNLIRLEYPGTDHNQLIGKIYCKKGIINTISPNGASVSELRNIKNFLLS